MQTFDEDIEEEGSLWCGDSLQVERGDSVDASCAADAESTVLLRIQIDESPRLKPTRLDVLCAGQATLLIHRDEAFERTVLDRIGLQYR